MHSIDRSIRAQLHRAIQRLDTDSARLDAEMLLASCLARPRSFLHAWPERMLEREQQVRFEELLHRRARGEPIAHLTGQREFWSLPLEVTADTLIPRPETETLVALALEKIDNSRKYRIADLGTGSGNIALAIAKERPLCEVIATDISLPALEVARRNAEQLDIRTVRFAEGDWCAALSDTGFDLILSNPPYVADNASQLDEGDVRFEPRSALVAGPQGMDELVRITRCASQFLCGDGWLMVEHGYDQGEIMTRLFHAEGYHEVSDHTDDAGLSRVTVGRHAA